MGMNSAPGNNNQPVNLGKVEDTPQLGELGPYLKEPFSWGNIRKMANWNSQNREATNHSIIQLAQREGALTAYFLQKPTQELLVEISNELKELPEIERMKVLALIPFNKLGLTPEQKKTISSSAIEAVSNYDHIREDKLNYNSSSFPAPSLTAVRGMAKSGILDYSQFLTQEDSTQIQENLKKTYFLLNEKAIASKLQDFKITDEQKRIDKFVKIPLSEESQSEIGKYFGGSEFGWKKQATVFADGSEMGYANLIIGKEPSLKPIDESMFPMNQRAWNLMPDSDFRLNFQFNQENCGSVAEITADVMAYAQMKGIPITSKITAPDDPARFKGRMLFYVDHNISQLLVDYMKKKGYIPEHTTVSTNDKNTYSVASFLEDDSISLRGRAESSNDLEKSKESFNWIVNKEKA